MIIGADPLMSMFSIKCSNLGDELTLSPPATPESEDSWFDEPPVSTISVVPCIFGFFSCV